MSSVAHDIHTVAEGRCDSTEARCQRDTPWRPACDPPYSRPLSPEIARRFRCQNMVLNLESILPASQARSHPRRIRQNLGRLSRVALATKGPFATRTLDPE